MDDELLKLASGDKEYQKPYRISQKLLNDIPVAYENKDRLEAHMSSIMEYATTVVTLRTKEEAIPLRPSMENLEESPEHPSELHIRMDDGLNILASQHISAIERDMYEQFPNPPDHFVGYRAFTIAQMIESDPELKVSWENDQLAQDHYRIMYKAVQNDIAHWKQEQLFSNTKDSPVRVDSNRLATNLLGVLNGVASILETQVAKTQVR